MTALVGQRENNHLAMPPRSLVFFKGGIDRLCHVCLPLVVLALAACSSSDAVEQQSRTAMSAAQTAVLTVNAWIAGNAPSHYAASTLQSLAKTISDAERQIQSDSSSSPAGSSDVLAAMTRLSAAIGNAEAAVKAGSRQQASHTQPDLQAAATDLGAASASYLPPKS